MAPDAGTVRPGTRSDAPFDHSAIEQAIASNLELQVSLKRELERIAVAKASNRTQTAHWTNQLLLMMRGERMTTPLASNDENDHVSSRIKGGASSLDMKRKWTRRFFTDRQTEPDPNPETVQRRAIEARYFFHHLQPPWSKKESATLLSVVSKQNSSNKDAPIDFANVATTFEQDRKESAIVHPRSEDECRIHYDQLIRQKSLGAFTNSEIQLISDRVQCASPSDIPWEGIATRLSTPSQKRTAWDCLVVYHAKIKASPKFNTTSPLWTVLEDELLLKFVAAAGPQTVIDSKNALIQFTLLNQLLPRKTKKQIFNRINQSLLNPNFKRSEWSEEEERRLPILMKIYSLDVPHEASAFRPDLFLASTHYYGRNLKLVADKWNRSINPDYSSRPFTTSDDQALLTVLRLPVNASLGWKQLSQKHFPDRHPQRLLNRWSELASDDDILHRERALRTAGPVVRNRKRPLSETNDVVEREDN